MNAKEFKKVRLKLELDRVEMARLLKLSGYNAVSNIELGNRNVGKFSAKFLHYLDSMETRRAKKVIEEINNF